MSARKSDPDEPSPEQLAESCAKNLPDWLGYGPAEAP